MRSLVMALALDADASLGPARWECADERPRWCESVAAAVSDETSTWRFMLDALFGFSFRGR